jgi:WD repeat-containing protein 6
LIWGGRRLAFGRIAFAQEGSLGQHPASSLAIGPEIEAADWILDATFAVSNQTSTVAYFVTAHNDVFALRSKPSSGLSVSVSPVASGLNSILYSAHIKPISAATVLVAAGTVFGEVIVWSFQRSTAGRADVQANWNSCTYKVFHGHSGSIFGVCLSNIMESAEDRPKRLLASCSDDRTIRLWDVSDCEYSLEQIHDVSRQHGRIKPQTGFGSTADASIANIWGHSSRIWGVDFINPIAGVSTSPFQVISRGEDATYQVWNLAWEVSPASTDRTNVGRRTLRFNHANADHHHFGKHIWSHAHGLLNSDTVLFTGGGDGGVIARSSTLPRAEDCNLSFNIPFHELFDTMKLESTRAGHVGTSCNDSIKQYVFLPGYVIIASTNHGHVIKCIIQEQEQNLRGPLSMNSTILPDLTHRRAIAVIASDARGGVVYLGSTTGDIWMHYVDLQLTLLLDKFGQKISNIFSSTSSFHKDKITHDQTTVRHLLVWSNISLTSRLLQIGHFSDDPESVQVLKKVDLSLPTTFNPTAFLEVGDSKHFVLGSRSGALAIYQDVFHQSEATDQIGPAVCARHVHGSDSVTCLQYLGAIGGSEQNLASYEVLSTGRDGSYAIHRITFQAFEARGTTPMLKTLHRSSPPFGPNIEGASVIKTDFYGTQLLLHGFDGKDFIVWNESTNSEVMRVPCGGAHRSWAYFSDDQESQRGSSRNGKCLVWTKAGVFNVVRLGSPAHEIIQSGGHGREIKAMALYNDTLIRSGPNVSTSRLFATGAEDTAIRLLVVEISGEPGSIKTPCIVPKDTATCIRILKKHTTGIQHLSFCKNFLFGSAGCEELFIWKINFGASVVNIGTVFQAALPKHVPASDLRITSFEVISVTVGQQADSNSEVDSFLIYAAYSNSMIRVFRYNNDHALPPEDCFQLLGEGFYNMTCLTNIFVLPDLFPWFLTASTNGAIAVWPDIDHRLGDQDSSAELSHTAEHHIHQNAILAFQLVRVAPEYHLMLTGGDDNAFGVTLVLEIDSNSTLCEDIGRGNSLSPPRFRTLLIPRAHTAAITALEVLESRNEPGLKIFTVISTGNDQRLKVWRIAVNFEELSRADHDPRTSADNSRPEVLHAIEVQLVKEMWTSVADVSSMAVIPDPPDKEGEGDADSEKVEAKRSTVKRLMVAGIGMELIRIDSTGERVGVCAEEASAASKDKALN